MNHVIKQACRGADRGWLSIAVLCTSLIAAGCSSTPAARVHSLLGPETVMRADAATAGSGGAFILDAVRVPTSVDQPQWLVRLPDDSLTGLESERWASPLRDELRQALLVQLVGRFGMVDARDDRAVAASAWHVRIDVLRFESIAGREARIEGTWTLSAPTQAPLPTTGAATDAAAPQAPLTSRFATSHCNWRFSQPATVGMPEMAAAHRQNMARLADALGDSLLRVQRGEPAACRPRS